MNGINRILFASAYPVNLVFLTQRWLVAPKVTEIRDKPSLQRLHTAASSGKNLRCVRTPHRSPQNFIPSIPTPSLPEERRHDERNRNLSSSWGQGKSALDFSIESGLSDA
jgi:hypothetical protein